MNEDKVKGWIAWTSEDELHSREDEYSLEGIYAKKVGCWNLIDFSLHKFPQDEVQKNEEDKAFFLWGYIYNKDELERKNSFCTWERAFCNLAKQESFPKDLRGGFAGFCDLEDRIVVYGDHVGSHAVYYACLEGYMVVSSRFCFVVDFLQKHHINLHIDEQACHYMLEQGFMLDRVTFAKEIKRTLPGEKVVIWRHKNSFERLPKELHDSYEIAVDNGVCDKLITAYKYYRIDNTKINLDMSENQAIELIDQYFRQAVKREFEKDKEYNYKHLTDLSGGLDSRMTAWVANQMGYKDQVNFTYCRSNYLDFKIAQKIAVYLKHPFFYMPLDDFSWFKEIDVLAKKYNGAASYAGLTGGKRFLEQLDCKRFGIEHTGMVGDAILSTFYTKAKYNYSKPSGRENSYTDKIKYTIPECVLSRYDNLEQFSVETRGLLGAQSSYFVRQDYVEVSSPFLDVDFLNIVFTIPFEYRKKHRLYMKWIQEKYPLASEFGWEKWEGAKPKISNTYTRKIRKWSTMFYIYLTGKRKEYSMNPMDFWYDSDEQCREYVESYFSINISKVILDESLRNDICTLFKEGGITEKEQVLTVLSMTKLVQGID